MSADGNMAALHSERLAQDNGDATDADRYPTLSEHGRRMLDFLLDHPHAPLYRNRSGNRLTAEEVEQVRAFEREVEAAEVGLRPGEAPPWLDAFVDRCFSDVPFYRRWPKWLIR